MDQHPGNGSTAQIANALADIELDGVVRSVLSEQCGHFEKTIEALQEHRDQPSTNPETIEHLDAAVAALRRAEAAETKPARERIAEAILSLTQDSNIPLMLKTGKHEPPAKKKANKELAETVVGLATHAGKQGISTGTVMKRLSISRAYAVQVCKSLLESGALHHNGRRGMKSRYYSKGLVSR